MPGLLHNNTSALPTLRNGNAKRVTIAWFTREVLRTCGGQKTYQRPTATAFSLSTINHQPSTINFLHQPQVEPSLKRAFTITTGRINTRPDETKGFINSAKPFGYHPKRDDIQTCIITCSVES